MPELSFSPEHQLAVWSWSGVASVNPSSSSIASRTLGDRTGRYKLFIGKSQWALVDVKANKTLGEGTFDKAQFKNKAATLNGTNIAFNVDGGHIDIFQSGAGAFLFSEGQKTLVRELNVKGQMDSGLIESDFTISSQGNVALDTVYLGGAGIPLRVYEKSTLIVSQKGFFIGQDGNDLWTKSFENLRGIQITGEGLFQTGGGWIGGGFGVSGALKGAAFASVMNALTTRTHNDCYFRFVYPGVDGTFQILSHTPRNLEIALSGIRNWLETKEPEFTSKVSTQAGISTAEQLEILNSLREKKVLSDEEFSSEKKRILGQN
jgi:hypothetical protein